jgi:hypothetical protein
MLTRIAEVFSEFADRADRATRLLGLDLVYADLDPQSDLAVGAVSRDCLGAAVPSFVAGPRTTGLRRADFEGGS